MRAALLTAAILGLAATAPGAVAQEGSEGMEAFARSVFAIYAEDGPWPLDERRLDMVWTPAMAAWIRQDRALATEEPPYLDADPLCQCQDADDLSVTSVRIETRRDGRVVHVRFRNGGEAHVTRLVLGGSPITGWKISDVLQPDGSSLAEALLQSNRRIEDGGRALGRD